MSNLSPYACPCGCGFDNPHEHLVKSIKMLEAWANGWYKQQLHIRADTIVRDGMAHGPIEYLVDVTSGGCCPGHHREVTRCRWCEGSGKRLQYHTTLSGTSSGIWKCPDCHGTGSTSPESYHLPRLWNTAQRKWHTCGKELHPWVKDAYHSLAAHIEIRRREKEICNHDSLYDERTDIRLDMVCLDCGETGYKYATPILDLAAMKAMTAFWADPAKPIEKQLWQGGWELHETDEPYIHVDLGPKKRYGD